MVMKSILRNLESDRTIARILYLFLCENEDEVNRYSKSFPSVTADVMFFCWRDICNDRNFSKLAPIYVSQWFGSLSKAESLIRFDPQINYTKIQPRVFIMNEKQLNLSEKSTWSTARNLLLERALLEERRQNWRWAYLTFGDGDIQVDCALASQLRETNKSHGDQLGFADHFRSLIDQNLNTDQCFVLFDTFLLSSAPAIGVIGGMFIPILYEGLLTQVVYNIDAMFNAFHHDAIPFVLPYCIRYDRYSWLTSQIILIYRSLCLYGHVIQFNGVVVTQQKHRSYPKNRDPWIIDHDMNLVPSELIPLQNYLNRSRTIAPLVLRQYNGWTVQITSDQCQQQHTFLNPLTCQVTGQSNTTFFSNTFI